MLVIITRTVIILLFLLLALRLMGKRQIGELQPFEFVITLVVADLACTPMQDIATPILYGLVPVFVVFVLHYLLTFASTHSLKFRKLLNGKPLIVVSKKGVHSKTLKQLNMSINDLLEGLRAHDVFSLQQVHYVIVEPSGNLSVLLNDEIKTPNTIPLSLVVEGKWMEENLKESGVSKEELLGWLSHKKLNRADILFLTKEDNSIFLQAKGVGVSSCQWQETGGEDAV